jgi:hypothetical protein
MKHERRLYLHGAGHYKELSSADAFNLFAEELEKIIAEEQKLYWRYREGPSGTSINEPKQ